MRAARGQASLEYVVVLAVVLATVGLGGAAAHASGIADAVVAQVVRGLCVVGRGECDADRRPCAVRWRRDGRGWVVSLSVLRLSEGEALLREQRSDGTVAVTLSASSGLALAAGPSGGIGVLDVALRGGALLAGGGGSTWVLPDAAAADRLMAAIARYRRGQGTDRDVPLPDEQHAQHVRGLGATFGAQARGRIAGRGMSGAAEAGVAAEHVAGERLEAATGRRTLYVEAGSAVATSLGGAIAGLGRTRRRDGRPWSGGALVGGTPTGRGRRAAVEVTLEGDGSPAELVVARAVPVRSAADLPAEASAAAGLLPRAGPRERTVVVEQRLDLTDAGNRAAAAALVDALRGRRPAAHAVAGAPALARRLALAAVVHVRAYEVRPSGGGWSAEVPVAGGSVGLALERAGEEARLVGAATRDLAGAWGRREDCLST